MFKKLVLFVTIIIFPLITISCNKNFIQNISAPIKISKPSKNFYTNSLINSIKNSQNIQISILYSKTGKNKILPDEYMESFNLFLSSIKRDFFVENFSQNAKEPEYKLTISLDNKNSFIINIFDEDIISIHPWDGIYEPDAIDISSLNSKVNIFNIVDFIIKNFTSK